MQFTNATPQFLTSQDLQRIAPAVFASHAAPNTSTRYAFIPTMEVVGRASNQ